jgi:hypothetical protein
VAALRNTHMNNITAMDTNKNEVKAADSSGSQSSQTFYHGTKASLQQGGLIEPGFNSNYGSRKLFGELNWPWAKGQAGLIL